MAKKKNTAPKAAAAPTALDFQSLTTDLAAILVKYNGTLWKVRDASTIALVAQLAANTVSTFLMFRR